MKSIVITGASGFLGQSLSNYFDQDSRLKLTLVSRSIRKKPFLLVNDFNQIPNGDVLIYLSENPDRDDVNSQNNEYITKSKNNLNLILNKDFKKIIYFSSSSVYGDSGSRPFEENSKVNFYDKYTELKLANEKKVLKKNGCVVRVSNVIGPKMSKKNIFSKILFDLKNNNQIILQNNSIRDFIWHEDLSRAILKLIFSDTRGIFNLGTGVGTSIEDLTKLILKISKKEMKIHTLDKNLKSYNVVNIKKISDLIEWYPVSNVRHMISLLVR